MLYLVAIIITSVCEVAVSEVKCSYLSVCLSVSKSLPVCSISHNPSAANSISSIPVLSLSTLFSMRSLHRIRTVPLQLRLFHRRRCLSVNPLAPCYATNRTVCSPFLIRPARNVGLECSHPWLSCEDAWYWLRSNHEVSRVSWPPPKSHLGNLTEHDGDGLHRMLSAWKNWTKMGWCSIGSKRRFCGWNRTVQRAGRGSVPWQTSNHPW